MTEGRKDKTLLIGLDAACWEYLDPLLEAGRLPSLQLLMEAGHRGVLKSTMPAMTPTAWSTLITGKNPGKHGVFEMLWHKPGGYSFGPTSAVFRQGTPFWKYLNDAGIRVGLINIPFTHPPTPIEGFMLLGFGSPNTASDLTWPPEAMAGLQNGHGPYRPAVATDVLRSGEPEKILAAEIGHEAHLIEFGLGLAERYPVDVLAINLMLTDHANHKLPDMALLGEAYIQADADLGAVLERFKPDNVMLISDHGSSRLKGDFLLNVWLRDQGYCIYRENTPSQRDAALDWILAQWFSAHLDWTGRPEKVVRRFIRIVLPHLPQSLQARLWNKIEEAIPYAESHVKLSSAPDFARTPIFPGSLYSGVLYFNVAGREPSGVVPARERKTLAARLKDGLSGVLNPVTGEPLFTAIYSSEELYSGAAAGRAPDLVVDAYGSQWNIRTRQPAPLAGKQHGRYFITFDQKRDFGWHGPDGIFVFAGPAFKPGSANGPGRLMDVPATLLHLYDVPLPDDWDGRVMEEVLSPELSRRPVRGQPGDGEQRDMDENALQSEDTDTLVDHLQALGYL